MSCGQLKHTSMEVQIHRACSRVAGGLVAEPSPFVDDPGCICVRVFGADEADVEKLEDAIYTVEDDLAGDDLPILLPMIKTIAVTRDYYPAQFAGFMPSSVPNAP